MSTGALLLSAVIGGCGSDETSGQEGSDAVAVEETQQGCEATVKVRGDVKAKWKAEGITILQDGGQAFYKTSKEDLALSVFPATEDGQASAVFTVKGKSYSTQEGEGVVEADAEGSGADVSAPATGVEPGSSVKLEANISCGEQ